MKIKNLFISDIHLGSEHSHITELNTFLTDIKKDNIESLYIVGDFIDGWKLQRNWYWPNEANLLIRKILGFTKRGTNVFIVAGNHDDFLREFIHDYHVLNFDNIHLGNEFIHETHGKRYLVIHGDIFDIAAVYAKWICVLGDMGYTILLKGNKIVNWFRKLFGMKKWSLSKAVKYNIKKAVNYISNFEECLSDYCKKKNCQGIICGHIHHPADKQIGDIHYLNCGCWVESLTAVAEMEDGNFKLLRL